MVKIDRIAPEIPAVNIRASIEYYEQKLGFTAVTEMPSGDYAIIERDGVAIRLFQDSARAHSPVGIHIFTNQLDDLHAELLDRGALISQHIDRKPWGNRDFRVDDQTGNRIKFTEPIGDGA